MSLNGVGNPLNKVGVPREELRPRVERDKAERGAVAPAVTTPTLRNPASAAPTATTLPAEPPPGTDPELWSVLTAEERAFFAKVGAMGPLTYGRVMSPPSPAQSPLPRGGRLDVRA